MLFHWTRVIAEQVQKAAKKWEKRVAELAAAAEEAKQTNDSMLKTLENGAMEVSMEEAHHDTCSVGAEVQACASNVDQAKDHAVGLTSRRANQGTATDRSVPRPLFERPHSHLQARVKGKDGKWQWVKGRVKDIDSNGSCNIEIEDDREV